MERRLSLVLCLVFLILLNRASANNGNSGGNNGGGNDGGNNGGGNNGGGNDGGNNGGGNGGDNGGGNSGDNGGGNGGGNGGCDKVDCEWGAWGAWEQCSDACGGHGIQQRTRVEDPPEDCGGKTCKGDSSESQDCNRFCYNDGTLKNGNCDCTDTYWGTCCDSACTTIDNCEVHSCTSGTDQECNQCEYDRGTVKAYRLQSKDGISNRMCEKICSWRPDSLYCYPGTCPDIPDTCQCAPGFDSPTGNCLSISSPSEIVECLVTGQTIEDGQTKEEAEVSCSDTSGTATTMTNVKINRLLIDWQTRFTGPSSKDYPKPTYIDDFQVGVVDALVAWTVRRDGISQDSGTVNCNNGISQDNPEQTLHTCLQHQDISIILQDEDTLEVSMNVTNGGYVKVRNYDPPSGYELYPTQYYSGVTETRLSSFKFDLMPPAHCSVTSGCTLNMLDRGEAYTKQGDISVKWSGWSDSNGIDGYELLVYKLTDYDDVLNYIPDVVEDLHLAGTEDSARFTLSDAGTYCVVLVVEDGAGNQQMARRFLMYDDTSDVTVDEEQPLYVSTAAANTSHTWITDPQYITGQPMQTTIKWTGHFLNEFHKSNKLLNTIGPHSPSLDEDYEERTGQPPTTRSMEAITNSNGMVKFEINHAIDDQGGRTITSPSDSWTPITNVQDEEANLEIALNEGESLRVWVRGYDVMGNDAIDSTLVHVDLTRPEINHVGLTRDGVKGLVVHNSKDLTDLILEFEAHDYQSGLKEVQWELHDKHDPSRIHGTGHLAAVRLSPDNCHAPECYCVISDDECFQRNFLLTPDMNQMEDPNGEHDYDYYFMITAINFAMLQTTYTFQITIDSTPPGRGVVWDSLPGEPDRDYQQEHLLQANWQNFFDKESGVMFYQYAFSDSCLSASDFSVPSHSPVHDTTETFASYEAPNIAKYHVTVVAYNNALKPSSPVCSDGICIDETPPELSQISINNVVVREGLTLDENGHVWYIRRDASRMLLEDADELCRGKATTYENLHLLPIAKENEKSSIPQCEQIPAFEEKFFISEEHKLELSWLGNDAESGIYDYRVGVGTNGEVADIMPFSSTHGHAKLVSHQTHLSDRTQFYLILTAINGAGIETFETFGPILVVATAPVFGGEIEVTHHVHEGKEYLRADWPITSYSPSDLESNIIYEQSYSIGHEAYGEDLQHLATLTETTSVDGVCDWSDPPLCVAVPIDQLDWQLHGEHLYYISLKVAAITGPSTMATSSPYTHTSGPPNAGLVIELSVDSRKEQEMHDIDYQSSWTDVRVKWTGFSGRQPIQYAVALGSTPSTSDIVDFTDITSETNEYRFTELQLEYYHRYYPTVKASNGDDSVMVSSDGIVILPVDVPLSNIEILDGPRCTSPEKIDKIEGLTHHHNLPTPPCGVNLQYQSSTNTMRAHWTLSKDISIYVTNVKSGVEKRKLTGDTDTWITVRELGDKGLVSDVTYNDMSLDAGATYRMVIQFCHPAGCYQKSVSDGVVILPDEPIAGVIGDVTNIDTASGTKLTFKWKRFHNAHNVDKFIARYDWTILVKDQQNEVTDQWLAWEIMRQKDITTTGKNKLKYEVDLSYRLEFTHCLVLAIRGYSQTGHYSTSYKNIAGCSKDSKRTLTVIDAVGQHNPATDNVEDIYLAKNAIWAEEDKEFTNSASTLSAVWPGLKHGQFSWKIISDPAITRRAYVLPEKDIAYADYDCTANHVVGCGTTQDNFINAKNLHLEDGKRYYVCIHAKKTKLHFETFSKHLPEISVCSNGIVVDVSPPDQGKVWEGSMDGDLSYYMDHNHMMIYWESFADVEKNGVTNYHSAISDYHYAIGSSPGGVDVRQFTSVGLTNMALVQDIDLRDGYKYYATVRATDRFGRTTQTSSPGVMVDATPPLITHNKIDVGGPYLTESHIVKASWVGVFTDPESRITKYLWCIGTSPDICDVMPYKETTRVEDSSDPETDLNLMDGHEYYVTVEAINGVGLSSRTSSYAMIVDTTAPNPGYVYETEGPGQQKDINYQDNTKILHLHWDGFHDAHSLIVKYLVSVTRCSDGHSILHKLDVGLLTGKSCEFLFYNNAIQMSSINVSKEVTLDHMGLTPGHKACSTVEACNAAGLCSTAMSDGVMPDSSPPSLGVIFDGSSGDIAYQISTTIINSHWTGFSDAHSGLSHYEWSLGTSPGGDDVMAVTRLPITNRATATLPNPLQANTKYYVKLVAYDKAGYRTEGTSNGFMIDDSPPIVEAVELDPSLGSLKPNTQVWKTSLTVRWTVDDPESGIVDQYLSVMTRDSIHNGIPTVKVYGNVQDFTFTDLTLRDGESYTVKVMACNAARLCTTTSSPPILVDNSPPSSGAFAVETDNSLDLNRHVDGWMTYTNIGNEGKVHLAWLGFADPHSNVDHYYVSIGTTYTGSELLNQGDYVVVAHTGEDGDEFQTSTITIVRPLQSEENIFVSVWAESKVGSISSKLHGTLSVIPTSSSNGTLDLVRRCPAISCEVQCEGHTTGECLDVKGQEGFSGLEVHDITDYRPSSDNGATSVDYTRAQCALGASWKKQGSGQLPIRYEWSVGIRGQEPGSGLLDVSQDPIWKDGGHDARAVYTTASSSLQDPDLVPRTGYVFYVRAWYDNNKYAIFTSDGINTDYITPEISNLRKVKEVKDENSYQDRDFISSSSSVTVRWDEVFRDSQAEIDNFVVAVGTHKGSDDIVTKTFNGVTLVATLGDLDLVDNQRYYTSVKAFNKAGLWSAAYSDGFTVDLTPPTLGTVFDGAAMCDIDFTFETKKMSAFWHGFSDIVSSLDHYVWCGGSSPGAHDLVDCNDVGLSVRASVDIEPITHGGQFFSTLYAVNGAGHTSTALTSNGLVIDVTPPVANTNFYFDDNLLKNPSFEDELDENGIPAHWTTDGTVEIQRGTDVNAHTGETVIHLLLGSLSQTFSTIPGTKHKIIFYLSYPSEDYAYDQSLGLIELPGSMDVFVLKPRSSSPAFVMDESRLLWQKHTLYFTAIDTTSRVSLKAADGKGGFYLDDVSVQALILDEQSQPNESPVQINMHSTGRYSTITASCEAHDPDSPIVKYQWAIGTINGGTQVQNFISTKDRSHIRQDMLQLSHGSEIHVTCVAENAAGLASPFYSQARIVDLTPPDVCCISAVEAGKNIMFVSSTTLRSTWRAVDSESGIVSCQWAIGTSHNSKDVLAFTETDSTTESAFDLADKGTHGAAFYITVSCTNGAEFKSVAYSDAITVILNPPDISSSVLSVLTTSQSYYTSRDSHQADQRSVSFGWGGIEDISGIENYEVKIETSDQRNILSWQRLGSAGETFADINGLGMTSYVKYILHLRATNAVGLTSSDLTAPFTVESTKPVTSAGKQMSYSWPSESVLELDWTGVFSSNSTLIYEVNIGTYPGSIDVLSWTETTSPTLRVTGVNHSKDHHITITAINKAGLFTSRTYTATYTATQRS